MRARFEGVCRSCGRWYPVGTDLTKGVRGWVHADCRAPAQAAPAAPAPTPTQAAPAPAPAPAPAGFAVRVEGKTLLVRTDWDWSAREAVTAGIKSIPGRRWLPEAKAWAVPVDQSGRLAALVERAAPALAAAIRALPEVVDATASREATVAASRAATVDTATAAALPCPEGRAYRPFQAAGIAAASTRPATLFGDEMGLGKTIQAVGVVNVCGARSVLVICPASLRLNWARELRAWLVDRTLTVGVVEGCELPEADVVVINYERVAKARPQIDARQWDLLVVDEAHYLKNPKAQRTTAVLGKYEGIAPIAATRRVFLTGTPVPNRPVELWPLVRALDPDGLGRSWKAFVTRYCAAHQTKYGWDVTGASNLAELQDRMRASFLIRRLKADVLKELPAKTRQLLVLPQNGSAGAVKAERAVLAAHAAEVERLAVAVELAKASDDDSAYEAAVAALADFGRVAFEEISKARHETALAKVEAVVEHVAALLEDGRKVVVFAHHKDVVAKLVEGLSPLCGVAVLTGDTALHARQAAVDAFQANPDVRVFVGTIAAAGVGLTLTASSSVVFAELDWVPGNLTQAEDRCHRIGQEESVLIQHLVLDGSIDQRLAETLVEKQDVIERALDREVTATDLGDDALSTQLGAMAARAATAEISRAVIRREAESLPLDVTLAVHEGLRVLAAVCDGAVMRDGSGFSGIDVRIGHSLAGQATLSPRQAALGRRLLNKYRRTQLPQELVARIWPEGK